MQRSNTVLVVIIVILLGVLGYWYYNESTQEEAPPTPDTAVSEETPQTPDTGVEPPQGEEPATPTAREGREVIGTSVEGNDIEAFHFGTGDREVVFVGGIHGGYEWNTIVLARTFIDELTKGSFSIPEDVRVTVIPVLNPDGLKKVVSTTGAFDVSQVPKNEAATIPGRFNANNVDLNRNFDCEWKESGVWRSTPVSGGEGPFSEPEAEAMRDYVEQHDPAAVVVYYSAAGGVFSSNCRTGVLPETKELTTAYAEESGYKAYENFDFYEITGDMVNWLAKTGIPAISVLLTDHTSIEWEKNRKGIEAVLNIVAE